MASGFGFTPLLTTRVRFGGLGTIDMAVTPICSGLPVPMLQEPVVPVCAGVRGFTYTLRPVREQELTGMCSQRHGNPQNGEYCCGNCDWTCGYPGDGAFRCFDSCDGGCFWIRLIGFSAQTLLPLQIIRVSPQCAAFVDLGLPQTVLDTDYVGGFPCDPPTLSFSIPDAFLADTPVIVEMGSLGYPFLVGDPLAGPRSCQYVFLPPVGVVETFVLQLLTCTLTDVCAPFAQLGLPCPL